MCQQRNTINISRAIIVNFICLGLLPLFCQCSHKTPVYTNQIYHDNAWSPFDCQVEGVECDAVDSLFFQSLSNTLDTVDISNSEANLDLAIDRFLITLFHFDSNGKWCETWNQSDSSVVNKYMFVNPIIQCCNSEKSVYSVYFNDKQFLFSIYYPDLIKSNGNRINIDCTNMIDRDGTIRFESFYKPEILQYENGQINIVNPQKSKDPNITFIFE